MNYKNSIEKFIEIFKRSNLSISKFAQLINKDRRTVTSWIDKITEIEPNKEIKDINPDNPFTSILTYLSSTVTPDDFGGPISFSASNIKDNSVFVNYFNVQ